MGVAGLLRARLVVPRSRAGELLNELYRFGDFHVTEQDGDRLREVEDLVANHNDLGGRRPDPPPAAHHMGHRSTESKVC